MPSSTPSTGATTITEHEAEQIERANATGRTPVVFIHGLWLLPTAGTAGRRSSRRPATRR